jgi:Nucleotide-sugar transporter
MLKRNPVRSPASGNNNNSGVIFIETPSVNGNGIMSSPASSSSPTASSSATAFIKNSNGADSATAAANKMSSFKLLLLALMVLQNSSTVLVGRYSRSNSSLKTNADLYVVNHLLVIIELGKLTLSLLLEFWTTQHGSVKKTWQAVYQHCFQNPTDALKIMVPALLYLVQNTLLYVALGNLTAPIFQGTRLKTGFYVQTLTSYTHPCSIAF